MRRPEADEATNAAATSEAAGWIEWGGGDCPVEPDTYVRYQMREEKREYAERLSGIRGTRAADLRWTDTNECNDIIAYRVVPA